MNFSLNKQQQMLQKVVKDFTEREIEPIAAKMDREGRIPDDLIKKLAQLQLLGMGIPEKYGGAEAGNLSCILACEQLSYSGTGAWWLVGFNNSIPESIAHYGSEELKQKYLRPLCDGTAYASIQFTEADTGSEPRALTTTALPDGDSYVINGSKRFSTFGARDGYAVLYAKDEMGNCTAFVVEKNVAGYKVEKYWELMGGGGMEVVDVYLENLRVPRENLLGEKGKGFDVLLFWIAAEKIEQCAASIGIAQAAMDEAVKYAKQRIVRDKPMSDMQGIRWLLAEMYTKMESARWLTYRAAFLQDQEDRNWMTEAAAAKVFVIPAVTEVVNQSLRLHGAYGYTKEFKIERLYRAIAGAPLIAVSLEINRSLVGASLVK
jgi:alkylation response protein AidB-like acyl-CoA dehydrogenase